MDQRLKKFAMECGLFEVAQHDEIDDAWYGDVAHNLVRAVEPEPDDTGAALAVYDCLEETEAYLVETAISWLCIEEGKRPPTAVAFSVMDAILPRLADDLSARLKLQPGERPAIERVVKGKILTGRILGALNIATGEVADGEEGATLVFRFRFNVGRVRVG